MRVLLLGLFQHLVFDVRRQLDIRRPDAAAEQMPQRLPAPREAVKAHQLRRRQLRLDGVVVLVGQLDLVYLRVPLARRLVVDQLLAEFEDLLRVERQLVPAVL